MVVIAACSSLRRNALGSKIGASSSTLSKSALPKVMWSLLVSRLRSQEIIKRSVELSRALQVGEVTNSRKLYIGSFWNVGCHLGHHRRRCVVILRSREQQRWHPNVFQFRPQVE